MIHTILDDLQKWVDSIPTSEPKYIDLVIRTMLENLPLATVRSITTYSLGVERRKSEERKAI